MKRRAFNLATLRVATTAAVVSNASAWAQNAPAKPTGGPINLKEGKDYQKLERPLVSDAGTGKIEVIEFFWYICLTAMRLSRPLPTGLKPRRRIC